MAGIESGFPDFDALWDYYNPSETEARFRTLLTTLDMSQDRNYHAQFLTQLARAQGLQRNFEQAHRTLDQAEALLTPDMAVARARYLLERGRVFNTSGSRGDARPFFLEALAAAQEAGAPAEADYHAVDAAHMLGIIEPPDEALEWNLKAVEMAEQSENSRARTWLGALYNNIGWTFHNQGKYEQALDAFHKSYDAWSANGTAKDARIARWCIARTLRSLGRLPEALQAQQQIVAEAEAAGDESGYGNEEIALCLLALGQPEAARPYAHKAFVILSRDPWLPTDEPERLERLQELGAPASQ